MSSVKHINWCFFEKLFHGMDMRRFENPLEKSRFRKGTQTYWKFREIANELLQEQSKCRICGSQKDLVLHHVIKCEHDEILYINPDNIIVLCNACHAEYHRNYPEISPESLIDFIVSKYEKKKKRKKNTSRKHRRMIKKWKYYFINWRPKNENN